MIVPEGYVSFEEVGRELQASYVNRDDSTPDGFDFDDAGWCNELWRIAAQLSIKGVWPAGGILNIPNANRRESRSGGWHGPNADYTPFENDWLDICDGKIISGEFAGCRLVILKVEWEGYLRERGGSPANKGGRPKHVAFEWYKARGFDRGGKYIGQLQSEMPKNADGDPPSPSTIRDWEKKYGKKPPPET